MPYIVIAIFLAGLSVGGFIAHRFDAARIVRLESAIAESNLKAEQELNYAKTRLEVAQNAAQELNRKLETEQTASLKKIDALTDRVADAGRLYARRQDCRDSVPKSRDPGKPQEATERADFSGRLAEIVRRADETALYAQTCWAFVTNNCGLQNGKDHQGHR